MMLMIYKIKKKEVVLRKSICILFHSDLFEAISIYLE